MGLKAKDLQARLGDLRHQNKDNPDYPKLKKIGDLLEVTINNQRVQGTPKQMLEKFRHVPYFTEEYNDIMQNQNDFLSYNLDLIDKQLKSKYD